MIYELRYLLVFAFFLVTIGCANGTMILVEPAANDNSRLSIQENIMDMTVVQSMQNEAQPMILAERDISQEELVERASFSLLWPTYLPEGFLFQRIGGFSHKAEQPVSGLDFVLNYGSGRDRWLKIQQSVSITSVNLSRYSFLDRKPIMGDEIPIYEKIWDKDGPFTILYFQKGNVAVYVKAVGMSKDEMLNVISGLESYAQPLRL